MINTPIKTAKKLIRFILLFYFFINYSCKSKKVFIMQGVDSVSLIEFCDNHKFSVFTKGFTGKDTLFGSWKKNNDTIVVNYTDYVINSDYDSTATIKESNDIDNPNLITILVNKDHNDFYYITINDSIEIMTDTLGKSIINNSVNLKNIKIEHTGIYYFANFLIKNKKANHFEINIKKPYRANVGTLSFYPVTKFIQRRRKLFPLMNGVLRKSYYYKRRRKLKLSLLDCSE